MYKTIVIHRDQEPELEFKVKTLRDYKSIRVAREYKDYNDIICRVYIDKDTNNMYKYKVMER